MFKSIYTKIITGIQKSLGKGSIKDFAKILDFRNIKFSVKIRDIHKIEKRNSIDCSVLIMKIRRNIKSMYQTNVEEKHAELFLGER